MLYIQRIFKGFIWHLDANFQQLCLLVINNMSVMHMHAQQYKVHIRESVFIFHLLMDIT